MSNKPRLSREAIEQVYNAGKEAVLGLVEGLLERIEELEGRVEKLERAVGKDSGNSSQPPSMDGLKRGKRKGLRERSGKASGGQEGHVGKTLTMVDVPERVEIHGVTVCGCCGLGLGGVSGEVVGRRQVFDLPEVRLEVVEHQVERTVCPGCGAENRGEYPVEVRQPVQYGTRIRAQMVLLHSGHFVPVGRTAELVEGLYGQGVSDATVLAAVQDAAERVTPALDAIRVHLVETEQAVHCDETGMRVEGKLHWVHSASSQQATLYGVHPKRGMTGMEALGVLPNRTGWVVHDGWKPYLRYPDAAHALCNAHHLRELNGLAEQGWQWATSMRECLLRIKHTLARALDDRLPGLHPEQDFFLSRRYDQTLTDAQAELDARAPPPSPSKRGPPKSSPAQNLLNRLRDGRDAVLAFMRDPRVPFDNNLAERDIRMVKLQQKVSGTFRSLPGAADFCTLRSYLSTARKNGIDPFDALLRAFDDRPFTPDF